jgi:hypothetical protein
MQAGRERPSSLSLLGPLPALERLGVEPDGMVISFTLNCLHTHAVHRLFGTLARRRGDQDVRRWQCRPTSRRRRCSGSRSRSAGAARQGEIARDYRSFASRTRGAIAGARRTAGAASRTTAAGPRTARPPRSGSSAPRYASRASCQRIATSAAFSVTSSWGTSSKPAPRITRSFQRPRVWSGPARIRM